MMEFFLKIGKMPMWVAGLTGVRVLESDCSHSTYLPVH